MSERVRYRRIFSYGSLQFSGHSEEYLAANTGELTVFIVQPRVGKHGNLLRRYRDGKRIEERPVRSSQNLLLYYLLWYVNHVRFLLRYCPKGERTLVFAGHPLAYVGMGLLRRLRPLRFSYWIGDYFPSPRLSVRLFERMKKWYHDRVDFAFYLTDAINRVMNGGAVADAPGRRTVMWGLAPFPASPVPPLEPFTLLFVGLIRPGQGLESVFEFLRAHRSYRLKIIGVCQPDYFAQLQRTLARLGLDAQVFFPNRFYSEPELLEVASTCHVGLALYDTSGENFTHYADPGKVKAYAEMRLPVLMTRISDIVPYVERFGSGEVIGGLSDLGPALERIRADYGRYQAGIARFIAHFDYEPYYRESFRALEDA
jgi:hypothetical protein